MSETLRAPVVAQSLLRATYSSSERRTLIVRDLGFGIVIVKGRKPHGGLRARLSRGENVQVAMEGEDCDAVRCPACGIQGRLRPRRSHTPIETSSRPRLKSL
jgi:hypothetical protein